MQRDDHFLSPIRRLNAAKSPRGQELDSLAEADVLRDRFFSWRGASGRRYVCSVFRRGEEGFVAAVESGAIVGVAREGASARPVCVFGARAGRSRMALNRLAHELGVAEWHVHFCAGDETARDLSASLLN